MDLQDDEVGKRIGGAGDCVDEFDDLDVVAVGLLCQKVRGCFDMAEKDRLGWRQGAV